MYQNSKPNPGNSTKMQKNQPQFKASTKMESKTSKMHNLCFPFSYLRKLAKHRARNEYLKNVTIEKFRNHIIIHQILRYSQD